jgi:hypothetical protein
MLFEGVLLALLIGLLAGGRMHNLDRVDLRAPWLLILAFPIQAVVVKVPADKAPWLAPAAPFLVVLSYLVLIYALARNWHLWGLRIALLGIALNFLVVAANGGLMPTSIAAVRAVGAGELADQLESGRYGKNAVLTSDTRLPFLADVHPLPWPYPRPCVISVGDVFITIGLALFIFQAVGAFGWRPRPQPSESLRCTSAR